jgi:hypothetical protein
VLEAEQLGILRRDFGQGLAQPLFQEGGGLGAGAFGAGIEGGLILRGAPPDDVNGGVGGGGRVPGRRKDRRTNPV